MMNIAFLHTSSFPYGGAEKVTSHAGAYLAGKGHNVFVFTDLIRDELLSDEDRKYLHTIKIDGVARKRSFSESLVAEIDRHGIDVIIMQGSPYWKEIKWLRRHTDAKIVYCNHNVPFWEVRLRDDLAERKGTSGTHRKRWWWKRVGKPVRNLLRVDERKFTARYRQIFNHADRYIVLCEPYREQVARIVNTSADHPKLGAITNWIPDRPGYSLKKKNQLLYAGRLTFEHKAVNRLLHIWNAVYRDFPDWELVLIGDGTDRDALMEMSHELGLERIRFCGHAANPFPYFNDAAIFCLTSTFEGWPLVLCEAQQAGVVPIAFDSTAGIRAIVAPDRQNGMLIPPFDMDEYVRRLSEMMIDENLRKRMQQNVLRKASDYRIEYIGPQWDTLLDSLKNPL